MRTSTVERLVHWLAVELNSGEGHPRSFTGCSRLSIAEVARRTGHTTRYHKRLVLEDLVAHLYATDPTYRPSRHVQRALGWRVGGKIEATAPRDLAAWLSRL